MKFRGGKGGLGISPKECQPVWTRLSPLLPPATHSEPESPLTLTTVLTDPPRRLSSCKQAPCSPCQPAMERWSAACCSWPHLLVFKYEAEAHYPRRAENGFLKSGCGIRDLSASLESECATSSWWQRPTCPSPGSCPFLLEQPISRKCNHKGVLDPTWIFHLFLQFSFHHYKMPPSKTREPRGCDVYEHLGHEAAGRSGQSVVLVPTW